MAFDRPIDADRIDDFNLFSAFVRAPLWILGSVLGGNPSIEKDDHDPVKTRSRLDENIPPGSADYSPSRKRVVSDYDLASSDRKTNSCGNNRKASPDGGFNSYINGPPGLKRSKNLSWSDESGKSLVEYNTQSVRHEPSPYSSVTRTSAPKAVVKSAMRRSRSIRSAAGSAADTVSEMQDGTRYIPKMSAAKNGLIIPTRPFGSDAANNGVESPQLGYGFYTNLTPPTPEMYQNHASRQPKSILGPSIPMHPNTIALNSGRSHQNQVFRDLQNNPAPMGWTSVPI